MTPTSLLDASAFLAYLTGEPGADVVEGAIAQLSAVSIVNWAEVLTKLADAGHDAQALEHRYRDAGLLGQAVVLVPFEPADAVLAARLYAPSRRLGLSLGDRACLAVGLRLALPILTTDRVWRDLDLAALALSPEIRLVR